jgi:hypothetical protein
MVGKASQILIDSRLASFAAHPINRRNIKSGDGDNHAVERELAGRIAFARASRGSARRSPRTTCDVRAWSAIACVTLRCQRVLAS